jgi:hypothetical protein
VLETDGGSIPVRVRNLSSEGVLVEGAAFPPLGAKVILLRGRLRASGEVAWHRRSHCGIKFDRAINLVDWVQRVGHSGQQRVDDIVAAIRCSSPAGHELQGVTGTENSLAEISAALDQVCERLAASGNIALQVGEELLRLNALAQLLRKIATGRSG